MPAEKINIEQFPHYAKLYPVLDVRSPGEFKHAHIPGAYNLPLFTDEERKIVGTLYKQEGRERAIKEGLDFFGPRMKKMVEDVGSIISSGTQNNPLGDSSSKKIIVHCWRGGMRSAAVAWLLDLHGFKVCTLSGGYKAYRNWVLKVFEIPFPLKILGGYTGTGKTEILKELEKIGFHIVDLEALASHKGSAFGNINMPPQPSQEMFENLLADELYYKAMRLLPGSSTDAIWIEDESQRIGSVNIPGSFWYTMRTSEVYFLDMPFSKRLKHIVEEYGDMEKEKVIEAILRIRKRLGGLETKNALEFIEAGKIQDAFSILLKYYDKCYIKGLNSREEIAREKKNILKPELDLRDLLN